MSRLSFYSLGMAQGLNRKAVFLRGVFELAIYLHGRLVQMRPVKEGATRNKIETWLAQRNREHLIIFVDQVQTRQEWQWARREIGLPL